MATTPAAATTTTATTASSEPGILELSPEPVYQERQTRVSRTAINQTHFQVAISGNGTLTLPNTRETISTTSTGSVLSALDGTATGKEVITTEDGSESATATTYGIARLEERRGIMIALVDTNSTGILAPLDGMILAGQIEYPPEETHSIITLWEWQSGIPLPTPTTPEELPPLRTQQRRRRQMLLLLLTPMEQQQHHLRKKEEKEKNKNNSSNNKQLRQYPHRCWNNNKKIAEQAIRSFLSA